MKALNKTNAVKIWRALRAVAIALTLVLTCTLAFLGCGSNGTREAIPDLDLATLKSLVHLYHERGEELSWDTFAPYYYSEEVGSGTYARRYSVDPNYELVIEGESIEEPPLHMRLIFKKAPNRYIDIRTEEIDSFVNAN